MVKCVICQTEVSNSRAKTCSQSKCKSQWKIQRNAQLPDRQKTCQHCGQSFHTKDPRNNFCSSECKVHQTRQTNLKKYGHHNAAVAWNQKADEATKQALRASRIEVLRSNWSHNKESTLSKRNQTNQARYGVDCVLTTPQSVEHRIQSLQDKYGTRSARIAKILQTNQILNYQEFAQRIIDFLEANKTNPYSETTKQYLQSEFGCTYEVVGDVLNYLGREDLLRKYKSAPENEIHEFLKEIIPGVEIQVNVRPEWMRGRELDFLIPEYQTAIEFHGLATHSERPLWREKPIKEVQTIHEQKYLWCRERGIRLIQIFEDEWRDRKGIIKSMIRHRLGKTERKIPARKCVIEQVAPASLREFFEANHIAGYTSSGVGFALRFGDEIVAAITMRKPFGRNARGIIEIARFATKTNVAVIGGFQKLFGAVKEWAFDAGYQSILTYADRRFGSGKVYLKAGFQSQGSTKPNYFYERNGIRQSRHQHQKSKELAGSTEREQQNSLGWYAIYDAGSERYTLHLNWSTKRNPANNSTGLKKAGMLFSV